MRIGSTLAAALLCVSCSVVRAQSAESGIGELSAFGGGAFGIGTHPFAGGSTGIAFSRYALALFDFSYSHLGQDTLRRQSAIAARNSNLYDFNVSAHIRYPITPKWAVYGIAGPSLLLNNYEVATMSGAYGTRNDVNFGFHTGGGVRYHVNDRWGIRPELRVVISNQTYVAFSVAVFFNTEWF
jgi:hypothetical protein